jgi:hypothetical protein
MERKKPSKFDECFRTESSVAGSYLPQYWKIIENRSSEKPTPEKPEKHHIVPREWLSLNVEGFNFSTEDPANVVYLSFRDKLLAMSLLAGMFASLRYSREYRLITDSISRRYGVQRETVWMNPFFTDAEIDKMLGSRKPSVSGRKMKYDTKFLERCKEVYDSVENKEEAFERVRKMGFRFTRRAFLDQLKKRGMVPEGKKNG